MVEMHETIEIDEDKVKDIRNVEPKVVTADQTHEQLIDLLAKEMNKLLNGVTSDPDADAEDGEELLEIPFNIYKQLTPFRGSEDDPSPFPYCTIKFDSSRIDDVNQREEVNILMDFGIYYDKEDRQYQHIFFHIFNLVRHRFIADNFLDNYRCEPQMTFALSPEDEVTYPHYFAGIGMKWMIPGIGREADFWS